MGWFVKRKKKADIRSPFKNGPHGHGSHDEALRWKGIRKEYCMAAEQRECGIKGKERLPPGKEFH